jgi:hypothetical protein
MGLLAGQNSTIKVTIEQQNLTAEHTHIKNHQ